MAQPSPRIVITYCTQCHWLLRAGWMAHAILDANDGCGRPSSAPQGCLLSVHGRRGGTNS